MNKRVSDEEVAGILSGGECLSYPGLSIDLALDLQDERKENARLELCADRAYRRVDESAQDRLGEFQDAVKMRQRIKELEGALRRCGVAVDTEHPDDAVDTINDIIIATLEGRNDERTA